MTKQVLLGALAGGVIVFLMGSVSHMALGLGDVGVKAIPQENAVVTALRAAIHEPGFYISTRRI